MKATPKTLLIVLIVTIAALIGLVASRPDSFRVERGIDIQAPADKIYALLDDFRKWPQWSPWENLDPAMRRTLSGAERGVGAVYAWDGSDSVGAGRMEILQADAPGKLTIKLDFVKPFEGHNTAEFTLEPKGSATHVRWAMFGPSPFAAKFMGLFFDMDQAIGRDFEKGLGTLKAAAEKP